MTTPPFKPLLAWTITDTSTLTYPVYVSKKLDGIRAIVLDGVVYSRSMKPIRSKTVQEMFGKAEYNGFDGELLYGPWNASNVFNVTTQAVMSTNLPEGFLTSQLTYAVFDDVLCEGTFEERDEHTVMRKLALDVESVEFLQQTLVSNEQELLEMETDFLGQGYEGIMVRSRDGRYKQGRSTAKEGICGKLKRFSDDEAIVTGFQEKMTNTNEAKTNEVGRSQRSQAQEGMVGAGTLGALECECKGIKFTMGSGFDDVLRAEVWQNRDKYIGKLAKFKHFEIGKKDSFRFPIFLGFRSEEDMS